MQVFRITPKRLLRINGQVLSPEMVITVTTKIQVSDPFYNSTAEIQEMYMRIYGFDYKKAGCRKDYFNVEALG